jgi:type IV pilus assembly protein PilA
MTSRKLKGFSLVELMVTLAVIGILVALISPKYRKWKAQGIMTEAKTALTDIYTAEKTFKEEYKSFHWHLPAIGFVPHHIDSTVANYPPIAAAERYYGVSITTQGTVSPSLATFGIAAPKNLAYNHQVGFRSGTLYCGAADTSVMAAETTAFGANLSAMTATTFKAVAVGCPMIYVVNGSTNVDRWTIDEGALLTHVNEQN